MDAPAPQKASSDPKHGGGRERAEALARTVVRCRDLTAYLESIVALLPQRGEAPFLYSQLDDVLRRLQASLKPLLSEAQASGEKPVGFLRRLALKRPESRARNEVRYDFEGNAWTIPVTELVGFLSHAGKSGLLWITTPGETFVLEFARGSLVHATSNAPPASLRLGEILLREKLLSAEELTELIEKAKAADELLGGFLVHTGRLGHAELQRAMSIQVQQLFHRLMDAENALFRFQDGAQLIRSHGLEVNITQLLLESARKKDEERQQQDLAAAEAEEPALHVLDLEEPEAPSAPLPAGSDALSASDAPLRAEALAGASPATSEALSEPAGPSPATQAGP